ncbi:MAG: hypothetical protein HQL06_13195 [Nitrospirae bacterium]|nr:hypothetical protein [Nitrospirota bacterium]
MEIINGATFGEDDLAEIINGETVVRHSPFCNHQRVLGDLLRVVGQHVNKNKLGQLYPYNDSLEIEHGKINGLHALVLFEVTAEINRLDWK